MATYRVSSPSPLAPGQRCIVLTGLLELPTGDTHCPGSALYLTAADAARLEALGVVRLEPEPAHPFARPKLGPMTREAVQLAPRPPQPAPGLRGKLRIPSSHRGLP